MTVAIVKNGEVVKIADSGYYTTEDGYKRPIVVAKEFGFYEYIEVPPTLVNQKVASTSLVIDDAAGTVTKQYVVVEKTADEVKTETNAAIDAQIDALERQQLLPRITRDMHKMVTLKEATALGITEANLLDELHPAYSPGYRRFYDFDAAIALLRSTRI